MVAGVTREATKDDVWITTVCFQCYSHCPIRVHRVDGVVVKIEGNPNSPNSNGRLCPRGAAGIMQLYDPNRVNVPLKRTNPEKGIGVDPKWVEITWDEALDILTEKLKNVRKDNPRGVLTTGSVTAGGGGFNNLFVTAVVGAPNFWVSGAGPHCGNAEHLFGGMLHAAWCKMPDTNYCNYLLNFGTPSGMGMYYSVTALARATADARARGMKQVVIEPYMGQPSEKADEWIPIRPGTDAAMALAMINLLLNEYKIYDAEYLTHSTNGPYLIAPDGHYVRDRETKKPLVWDVQEGRAKTYDDPSVKELALEGSYTAQGARAWTAFSILKDHVKKYTPETAADLTGVPAATIRRLAREFGENARIGSTIVVQGHVLPYRPVAVLYFKGAQGHKNSTLSSMAMELLTEIVGASNVPGGLLGLNASCLGHPETGRPYFFPSEGPDGLMVVGNWAGLRGITSKGEQATVAGPRAGRIPYPHEEARPPDSYTFHSLVPTAVVASPLTPIGLLEREKYKLPYKIDLHLHWAGNYLMTLADPNLVAKAFKDVFTVSFSLYLDESTALSDVVLPDASYLERWELQPDTFLNGTAVGDWTYHLGQPVVKPMHQRRPSGEVLLEVAERMGALPDFNALFNLLFVVDPYRLDLNKKYTLEELTDRRFKSLFGEERGVQYMREHGGLVRWPKQVEEMYWHPFTKARVPIYFESIKTVGEDIERVKKEHGIPDFPTWAFQALPDWHPCPSHEETRPDFDLFAFYFRVPFHTFTSTANNAWLDEVGRMDPYAHFVVLNEDTAGKKGIRDGDWVEVESGATAGKVKAKAKLSQAIHPECAAISGFGGRWAKGLPIANQPGKGAAFAWLLPLDFEHMDVPNLNQDICVKVKISRVEA